MWTRAVERAGRSCLYWVLGIRECFYWYKNKLPSCFTDGMGDRTRGDAEGHAGEWAVVAGSVDEAVGRGAAVGLNGPSGSPLCKSLTRNIDVN